MNDSNLRLYVDAQFTSPYAMSCFVTLREKGIEFEMSTLDLGKLENQTSDYARLSLTQRVPTLVHGGFALSESSAITEYLEEVFPQTAVYPPAPTETRRGEASSSVVTQRFASDPTGALYPRRVLWSEIRTVVSVG